MAVRQTLAQRFLDILAEGGPRKPRILRALANNERQFINAIRRLRAARLIVVKFRYGGPCYALKKTPTGETP